MEALELNFCCLCSDKILSRELSEFWKITCLNSIAGSQWVPIEAADEKIMLYLKVLEEKRFLTTIDHEDEIFAKPHGIISDSTPNSFLVCLCPSKHFIEGHN